MTNNEKIQRAEELITEATKLLNEVKADKQTDIISFYKEFLSGTIVKYYLTADSEIKYTCTPFSFDYATHPYRFYPTKELAEQAKVMKDFNDKLLAFKYCYDRDYEPDWNDIEIEKWSVYFDTDNNKYYYEASYVQCCPNVVYFSCEIVAKECCKWLNSLKENES
jgi:hypothetical protein